MNNISLHFFFLSHFLLFPCKNEYPLLPFYFFFVIIIQPGAPYTKNLLLFNSHCYQHNKTISCFMKRSYSKKHVIIIMFGLVTLKLASRFYIGKWWRHNALLHPLCWLALPMHCCAMWKAATTTTTLYSNDDGICSHTNHPMLLISNPRARLRTKERNSDSINLIQKSKKNNI